MYPRSKIQENPRYMSSVSIFIEIVRLLGIAARQKALAIFYILQRLSSEHRLVKTSIEDGNSNVARWPPYISLDRAAKCPEVLVPLVCVMFTIGQPARSVLNPLLEGTQHKPL